MVIMDDGCEGGGGRCSGRGGGGGDQQWWWWSVARGGCGDGDGKRWLMGIVKVVVKVVVVVEVKVANSGWW